MWNRYCWEIYLMRVLKLKRIKELEEFLLVENNVIKNVGNCNGGQWHSSDDINQKLQYARSPDESANVSARTRSHAPARTRPLAHAYASQSCPHTLVFGPARISISGRPTILPERRLERPSRDAPRKIDRRSSSLHIRRMPRNRSTTFGCSFRVDYRLVRCFPDSATNKNFVIPVRWD